MKSLEKRIAFAILFFITLYFRTEEEIIEKDSIVIKLELSHEKMVNFWIKTFKSFIYNLDIDAEVKDEKIDNTIEFYIFPKRYNATYLKNEIKKQWPSLLQ